MRRETRLSAKTTSNYYICFQYLYTVYEYNIMIPLNTRKSVLRKAQHRCEFCNKPETEQRRERKDNAGLHLHHIWPRREGGGERERNLIALCDNCHAQIEAKTRFEIRKHKSKPNHITKQYVRLLVAEKLRDGHHLDVSARMVARYRLRSYGADHTL